MNILTCSHTITLCDMFVLNQRPCTGNLIIGFLRIIYFLEMRNCSLMLAIDKESVIAVLISTFTKKPYG